MYHSLQAFTLVQPTSATPGSHPLRTPARSGGRCRVVVGVERGRGRQRVVEGEGEREDEAKWPLPDL